MRKVTRGDGTPAGKGSAAGAAHLPADGAHTKTGDSLGRWEGDTLVVETTPQHAYDCDPSFAEHYAN
jgi:hypothetical protein